MRDTHRQCGEQHSIGPRQIGAMNNEQPVTKRQRIDGRNGNLNGIASGSNSSGSGNSSGSSNSVVGDANGHSVAFGGPLSSSIDELDFVGGIAGHQHANALALAGIASATKNQYLHPPAVIIIPHATAAGAAANSSNTIVAIDRTTDADDDDNDVWLPLLDGLAKQCLCSVGRHQLKRPFRSLNMRRNDPSTTAPQSHRPLAEWPVDLLVPFLSHLQLFFEVYLKQMRNGRMCRSIRDTVRYALSAPRRRPSTTIEMNNDEPPTATSDADAASALRSHNSLVPELLQLADSRDELVRYLAGRVLSMFLLIGQQRLHQRQRQGRRQRQHPSRRRRHHQRQQQQQQRPQQLDDGLCEVWLQRLVANLFDLPVLGINSNSRNHHRIIGAAQQRQMRRMGFSLEIFGRILEWNDVDTHPLDDDRVGGDEEEEENAEEEEEEDEENDDEDVDDDVDDDDDDVDVDEHENETLRVMNLLRASGGNGHQNQQALPPMEVNYFNQCYGGQSVTEAAAASAAAASSAASTSNPAGASASVGLMSSASVTSSSPSSSRSMSPSTRRLSPSSVLNNHSDGDDDDDDEDDDDDDDGDDFDNDDDDDDENEDSYRKRFANECDFTDAYVGFHSAQLKCAAVRLIGDNWPDLYAVMSDLMGTLTANAATSAQSPAARQNAAAVESLLGKFLDLWRTIIAGSAKNAFLTVNDTRPFYVKLEGFGAYMRRGLPPAIYKQLLQLFNTVLCYGDALATEMAISDETYNLALVVLEHLRDDSVDGGLLRSLPESDVDNPVSLIGYAGRSTCTAMMMRQMEATTTTTTTVKVDGCPEFDKTLLQQLVLLVLKSVAVSVRVMRSDSSDSSIDSSDEAAYDEFRTIAHKIRPLLEKLNKSVKEKLKLMPDVHFSRMLVDLFIDQDDFLIEAMVCTLDVAAAFRFSTAAARAEVSFVELTRLLNPVHTFLEFVSQTNYNGGLLLEYLTKVETCFLLYFLRFLKYVTTRWQAVEEDCASFRDRHAHGGAGQQLMLLLDRLRLAIGKMVREGTFPYNIWPVLQLMDRCLALWDSPL